MPGVRLAALLVGVTFVDELAAGVPMFGAPDIEAGFSLSYETTALLLFVLPLGLSVVFEPPLLLLAGRRRRKPFVVGSLTVLAAGQLVAGLSPSLPVSVVALALLPTASGCACGVAQATMVDAEPERREQWMTRWALLGSCGDLAAAAIFALLGGEWRLGFVASGAITGLYALLVARHPFPPAETSGDPGRTSAAGWSRAVSEAFANRPLLLWLGAVFLCSLLDEVLVAFGGLYLREHLGAGPRVRAAVLAAFTAGSIAGLVATDRLLERIPARRLLIAAALGCTVSYLGWLTTTSLAVAAVLLALVGLFAAPLYPIAKAQAYRALPGRATTVNAIRQLSTPAEIAVPYVLAVAAERWGLPAALFLLVVQPVGILAVAFWTRRTMD